MNFKQKAQQLEKFLEEELKKLPLVVLPDKTIVYKTYKIKQNKHGDWILRHGNGDFIDSFRIKATASLAAKFYEKSNLKRYNEIKILDSQYWNSSTDSLFFSKKLEKTKDPELRDLFVSRFEVSKARTEKYKQEISTLFKTHF